MLPALAAASLVHAHQAHAAASAPPSTPLPLPSLPPAERMQRAQDAIRDGYALRPDVGVLVAAVLPREHDAREDGTLTGADSPVSYTHLTLPTKA